MMKFILGLVPCLLACVQLYGQSYPLTTPQPVIIAGQLRNYDPLEGKDAVSIYLNDVGMADQISLHATVDSLGHFWIQFDRYYPQDVMIEYRTNFRILIRPGDSLHVVFDGKATSRSEIFQSVAFSGDAASLNIQLVEYLKEYFRRRPAPRWERRQLALREGLDYQQMQDSIQGVWQAWSEAFIETQQPEEELTRWIRQEIELHHLETLLKYPVAHSLANGFNGGYINKVMETYDYDFLEGMYSLTDTHLVNSTLKYVILSFRQYLMAQVRKSFSDEARRLFATKGTPAIDSAMYRDLISLLPKQEPLRQLTMANYLQYLLGKYRPAVFEANQDEIERIITEPYLLNPLKAKYHAIKKHFDAPQLASSIEVSVKNMEAETVWKQMLDGAEGKVLYIDCWTTWCGPCIMEFPYSSFLMDAYKGKPVEFVYLCLDGGQDEWKAIRSKYELPGKHYFLNGAQAAYFQELFEVSGYPTYVIIDQEGRIVRKGSSWRPSHSNTQDLIDTLLKQSNPTVISQYP